MSYSGQTYAIDCSKGGLTANPNIDSIPAYMMTLARNINIDENGRGKRGGTSKLNATAGYDSTQLTGGFDFIKLSGTQKSVIGTTNGKLWQSSTVTIKTGLTAGEFFSFEVFEDELYICNGADTPQTWNGTAAGTSNITTPAADWTGTNQPFQMVKHGRGNSERLWAILPSGIYASADGDGKEFVTGMVNIPISANSGLTGAVEFGDRLIVFNKNKAFVIDDADTNTANWGYEGAIWEGGASHWRLIVKTPNDVVCMMDDGNIYSLTAVQSYGDYKSASITKPSWMDKWIRENCDLGQIDKFHAVYDGELRLIRFFIVRTGQTQVDTCLVYFIDRGPDGWVIHDNQNYNSGFKASASWIHHRIPAEHHSFYVYTGDYSGFVWELEETNANDGGNPYYGGFKTARTTLEQPRLSKRFDKGWIITKAQGDYNLNVQAVVDNVPQTTQTVSLSGTGAVYGTGIYGTDIYGGDELIDKFFNVGVVGRRIMFEIYNSGLNETFFISQILQDFKPLGNRPS